MTAAAHVGYAKGGAATARGCLTGLRDVTVLRIAIAAVIDVLETDAAEPRCAQGESIEQ
ncbi:hypothetical protein [Sphingomonas sp. TZW2008]|uniref:hypothetical protein n=1 Tax=Sphingomonas sp. TZW2008 TaxID=1917973 RepID=UPI0015C50413|nr:hypothetical protein [Sphingomonas sp. TZW2008]